MKPYKKLLDVFLAHLQEYNNSLLNKIPRELYEPESYILSLGGKRIRPLFALIACDLFGENPKKALNSALAVELFHNFSLIHDDILDKAPLRRNHPTVHTKWNTNSAILCGDVMLVKASQVLNKYSATEFKKLSALLHSTAIEVCEGQQFDMNFESQKNVGVSDYLNMITLKTAVLLGCSLKMGAINANASSVSQNKLYNFGVHLGIAFQLLDDYLDAFTLNAKNFGKQIGGDILANKKTFLLLSAFETATLSQKKELNRVLLLPKNKSTQKVKQILNLFEDLNVKELCLKEAQLHTTKALEFLSGINANEQKKEQLKLFALDLLNRQS